jgi:cathepsin X
MKSTIAYLAAGLAATTAAIRNELVLQDPKLLGEVIRTPKPHTYIKSEDLPENFDWRDVNGRSFVTSDQNQHIPVYCGSCWAFAALSSMADRIKIATNGTRDVMPAVQVLINCGTAGSCNGGDSHAAYHWIYENPIPDVTCQQYQAKNMQCSEINTCMNCDPGGAACYEVTNYPTLPLSEYGSATGDDEIMAEIYARGPLACYLDATCLEDYEGGIEDYEGCGPGTNHAISLAGWGVDSETGTSYWVGRNSWGTYWGERGWFKIVRGGAWNPRTCYWGVPDVSSL